MMLVGPRDDLEVLEKRKKLFTLPGFGPQNVQPVAIVLKD
jgi:hypothetical protein